MRERIAASERDGADADVSERCAQAVNAASFGRLDHVHRMSAIAQTPTSLLVHLIGLESVLSIALHRSSTASILVFESRPAAKITFELTDEIVELTGVLVDGRMCIAQRLQHQTICFH